MIRGKGDGFGEGQMKQKVLVAHCEAQLKTERLQCDRSQSEHHYFLVWKSKEGRIHSSAWSFQPPQRCGCMATCAPPPTPSPRLPGMLNTRLNWATVRTAYPPEHLSTTIRFALFVSQWLGSGPALRCFPGNTGLRCRLGVYGVHPAGVKEQLMESVVLFLLI